MYLMAVSVVFHFPIALLTVYATRTVNVWFVAGVWYIAYSLVMAAAVQMRKSPGLPAGKIQVLHDIRHIRPMYFPYILFGNMDWALFALAASLSDPLIPTVLFETWPVAVAIGTMLPAWRHVGPRPSARTAPPMLALLVVASIAAAFVISSVADPQQTSQAHSAFGLTVSVLAPVATAAGVLATMIASARPRSSPAPTATEERSRLTLSITAVPNAAVGTVMFLAGTVLAAGSNSGATEVSKASLIAVMIGLLLAFGTMSFYVSSHLAVTAYRARYALINSLNYAVPIGSVALLAVFGETAIRSPLYLAVGIAGIIAANAAAVRLSASDRPL